MTKRLNQEQGHEKNNRIFAHGLLFFIIETVYMHFLGKGQIAIALRTRHFYFIFNSAFFFISLIVIIFFSGYIAQFHSSKKNKRSNPRAKCVLTG
jgi:heme/copper-type cytochrome/quinol oxidase subunit 2